MLYFLLAYACVWNKINRYLCLFHSPNGQFIEWFSRTSPNRVTFCSSECLPVGSVAPWSFTCVMLWDICCWCRKSCQWFFPSDLTSADCLSHWLRIFHQLSLVTYIVHPTRGIGIINWKVWMEGKKLNATLKTEVKREYFG